MENSTSGAFGLSGGLPEEVQDCATQWMWSYNHEPAHGLGMFHPEAAFGQGCITALLLGSLVLG